MFCWLLEVMNPDKTFSTLLLGNDFEYDLFKTAIFFAESGMNVWFISPEVFEKIPENIDPPGREVLELITFLYLKDHKYLLSRLNGIHLWHKIPDIVILSGLDTYCNLYCDRYNSLLAALVSTALLDSISVCAQKKQRPCYLILTCSSPSDIYRNRLQVLHDMYFPHIIHKLDNKKLLLDCIVSYFAINKMKE